MYVTCWVYCKMGCLLMPSKWLVLKNTVLSVLFFSQKMYFCTKNINQPMQHCNVKKVRRENKVKPRLYLSFTPSSVQGKTRIELHAHWCAKSTNCCLSAKPVQFYKSNWYCQNFGKYGQITNKSHLKRCLTKITSISKLRINNKFNLHF